MCINIADMSLISDHKSQNWRSYSRLKSVDFFKIIPKFLRKFSKNFGTHL